MSGLWSTNYLERIAGNTDEIMRAQANALAQQASSATTHHRQLAEIGFGIDAVNTGLSSLGSGLNQVSHELSRIETASIRVDESIWGLSELLESHLTTISEQIAAQQQRLDQIADVLRRPMETQVQEIRRHADDALHHGMTAMGKRREEWFQDAIELLERVVEYPIGKQDYVAWFEIGCLQWRKGALRQAEESFSRAVRLASAKKDEYYLLSLCHLAQVYYERWQYPDAISTMKEALESSRDPYILYNAARYYAVAGDADHAIPLAEEAIAGAPLLIITIIADISNEQNPYFANITAEVEGLITRLTKNAREKTVEAIVRWQETLRTIDGWSHSIGQVLTFEEKYDNARAIAMRKAIQGASYLVALEIEHYACVVPSLIFMSIQPQVDRYKRSIESDLVKYKTAIKEINDKFYHEKQQLENNMKAEIHEIQSESELNIGCIFGVFILAIICIFVIAGIMSDYPKIHPLIPILLVIGIPVATIFIWLNYSSKMKANAIKNIKDRYNALIGAVDNKMATETGKYQFKIDENNNRIALVESILFTMLNMINNHNCVSKQWS